MSATGRPVRPLIRHGMRLQGCETLECARQPGSWVNSTATASGTAELLNHPSDLLPVVVATILSKASVGFLLLNSVYYEECAWAVPPENEKAVMQCSVLSRYDSDARPRS